MKLSNLAKDKRYLIGVSGGCDSMALLDMCRKAKLTVMVAHMNYQKRASATRDMQCVQEYCSKHGITCIIKMQNKECHKNFQAFAREERYAFFKQIYDKHKIDALLIAHHLDDALETYVMQTRANRCAKYFGIDTFTILLNMQLIRPLLTFDKATLEAYCKCHKVPFKVDESNLDERYTRNHIRMHELANLHADQKAELLTQMQTKNANWQHLQSKATKFLKSFQHDITSLKSLDEELRLLCISRFIHQYTQEYISYKECKIINDLILHHKKNWKRNIKNTHICYCDYGILYVDLLETKKYRYVYERITFTKTKFFEIAATGAKNEALTLKASDFPIIVRNALTSDSIQMRFGKKRIQRWFIDRKIPHVQRKSWPIIENALGKVILVPKLGCDVEHFTNNPNIFVVK